MVLVLTGAKQFAPASTTHPASQRFEALNHAATDPKGIGRAPQPATFHYPFHTQVGVTLTDMIFAPRTCLRHCALDMFSLLLELRIVPLPPDRYSAVLGTRRMFDREDLRWKWPAWRRPLYPFLLIGTLDLILLRLRAVANALFSNSERAVAFRTMGSYMFSIIAGMASRALFFEGELCTFI
mgnify:CR=1 FL=1